MTPTNTSRDRPENWAKKTKSNGDDKDCPDQRPIKSDSAENEEEDDELNEPAVMLDGMDRSWNAIHYHNRSAQNAPLLPAAKSVRSDLRKEVGRNWLERDGQMRDVNIA
jgi:hypothetical protein